MSIPMLGDQKIPVTINIKGDKTLSVMDIPMQGSMKMYGDRTSKKMTMVQEAQKQGVEIDLAKAEEMKKSSAPPSAPKATGKKETISGFSAEEYSITSEGGVEIDQWLSKDIPKDIAAGINSSQESSMQMSGSSSSGFLDLLKKGYAPLRTVVKKDGDVQMIMNFTKAEQQKLDDKLFVISQDIKVQKMDPSMMNPNAGGDGDSSAPVQDTMKKSMTPDPKQK
jgi:hypothetical protein